MAEDFKKSKFDALDICSLLPTEQYTNGNFNFTCHNVVESDFPFESNTFDYVQQSMATLSYKIDDWPIVLSEIKRVTKSGGFIQLIEPDMFAQQLGPQGEIWRDQSKLIAMVITLLLYYEFKLICEHSSQFLAR